MRIVIDIHYPGHWVAVTDNYDGGGSPIGQGGTPREAVEDLLDGACMTRTEEPDAWRHCRLCRATRDQPCLGDAAAMLALSERGT